MPLTDRRTTLQAWAAALAAMGWPQVRAASAAVAQQAERAPDVPGAHGTAARQTHEGTGERPQAALAARTLPDALAALGLPGLPPQADALRIDAPALAENGAAVPVAVRWAPSATSAVAPTATPVDARVDAPEATRVVTPGRGAGRVAEPSDAAATDGLLRLALLVEGNAQPLALLAELDPALEPVFGTRLKFADSAQLWALVRLADGRWFSQRASVRVVQGGCAV
ncbi:MAG: thiosulfate oxidation carrier protein SoxY [Pseudomonadota bacterium]|jgi:predicted secreted protein